MSNILQSYHSQRGSSVSLTTLQIPVDSDRTEPVEAEEFEGTRAVVVEPYNPRTRGELALKHQDLVVVLDRGVDDWWIGENGEEAGLFPANVRSDCDRVCVVLCVIPRTWYLRSSGWGHPFSQLCSA